ncbi:hypothetical protein, partial [Facilibium subflavum]|uniref:hypothetical protein n=1 Tax=Facilibium subflavum TaxID=2219058 RepID=UPI0013C374F8
MHQSIYWLLLSLALLSGCSSKSSSTEEPVAPGSLQLSTVIHAPSSASKVDQVHLSVQVLNADAPSSILGVFAAVSTCAPVTITGVDESSIAKNNISLTSSILDYAQEVGPGEACWNGVEGATLACGETCNQTIRYSTIDKAKTGSIYGDLIFTAESGGASIQSLLKIDTVFDDSAIQQSLPAGLNSNFSIRPNGQFTLELNNNSNQALNTIYVDLSGINNLLEDTMAYELTSSDGYYDAKLQRWIFLGIEPNKTTSFSYILKDTLAQKFKDDPYLQTTLINNSSNNPVISIGATNRQQVYPAIIVNTLPYDYVQNKSKLFLDQTQMQDMIQLNLPSNSLGSLVLSSLTDKLPEGVSISSNLAQGQLLKPGEALVIAAKANPQAIGNTGKVSLTFTGGNGQLFSDSFDISLNAMTTLTNQQNNLILVGSSDLANPISVVELQIHNSGKFDAQLPADLLTAFNLDGLSLASNVSQTCQNKDLKPGDSCTITLVAPTGMNKIADIKTIGDGKNILADISLAKIQVLENSSDVAIVAPKAFPNKIKANESVNYEVSITPVTGDLEVQTIEHPAGIDASQCQWVGETLPVDNLLKDGMTYTYQCAVTPAAGESITGKISIDVKQGETTVEVDTPVIQTEGVNENELPINGINVNSAVVFGLGSDVTFTVKNNTSTAMTGLKIDLSGLSAQLRQALVLSSLTQQDSSISYDNQTGIVTIDDILLPQDTKNVVFYLDISPDNLAALKANEDKINNNFSQKQAVRLSSQTAQDFYPPLVANSNIVEGIPTGTISLNSDNQTSFSLNNNTNEDLDIEINFADQDVQQALQQQIASIKDKGILANGSAAITLSLPADSTLLPGVYSGNLTLTETNDKQSYRYEIKLSIPNSNLTVVSSNIVADIPTEGTSETPVILRNDGRRDLFGISLSDSFIIADENGNVIDSSLISLSDPSQGGSIVSMIKPSQQATLGIELHASDSWTPNTTYYVSSQSTNLSNLEAESLFSFRVDDISPGLVIDTQSSLPDQVLPDKTLTYEALVTNDPLLDAYTYKVQDVIVNGENISFDPSLAIGANQYLFTIDAQGDKQGATLTPGQSATLKFDLSLSQGEVFTGDVIIKA